MTVVFRVDASLDIGTGHVMRCLTLAAALRDNGTRISFISREHPGNVNNIIVQNGFKLFELPYTSNFDDSGNSVLEDRLSHSKWLGVNQEDDARQCEPILKDIQPDWLIVDHYAIDHTWHKRLKAHIKRLMVIDDIADREHECDLLLDQNYGKHPSDYLPLVSTETTLLLGTDYALLRPEFLQWRDFSLKRRYGPELKQILITMGGIDANNATSKILSELNKCHLPKNALIIVVMGSSAPWLEQVNQQAKLMPYPTEVHVGITNMAEIMANSDLAIGAAGSTSWERCCLGLPAITVVLAENQKAISTALEIEGAAIQIESDEFKSLDDCFRGINAELLVQMSNSAAKIVDGKGVKRVLNYLSNF